MTTQEMIEIVDDEDTIVGSATRKDVDEKALIHRTVFIIVENKDRKLLIQKRSRSKSVFPGLWDLSASETVRSGEYYESAARRGMKEELGVIGKPQFLFNARFRSAGYNSNIRAFYFRFDGEITLQKEEIDEVRFASNDEIESLIRKKEFCPDGAVIFYKYVGKSIIDILDESGKIIRQVTRKELREKALLNRVARIIVFNSEGKILAQKRSMKKDIYPGMWDIGVAGTLETGESYEETAVRELKEELGIKTNELECIFNAKLRSGKANANYQVYRIVFDGRISKQDDEIDEIKFLNENELNDYLANGKLSPGAAVTFKGYLESRKIKITGHRGAGFLEPENTIRAIEKGIELGVDLIEIDVRMTKDGEAAVIHDDTLGRTTNGNGKVSGFILADLRKLDAGKGEKIPTLDEVLAATQGKVILQIELKDDFLEELVVAAVKRKSAENSVIIISFNHERLKKIKNISSLETGLICVETENNIALAKNIGASILLHNFKYINKNVINSCRKAGLKVGVWNPDTEDDIKSMIISGPDIISSNRPDILLKLVRHHDSHVEFIDVVDESDSVIGSVSWKEMNEKGLLHRTSNVIVQDASGNIFVHRRADHLKLYPGLWDVKFGGSVRSGESYEATAKRELFEEAGISDPELSLIFKLRTNRKENNVHRSVFKCIYNGPIILDQSEVAEGRFMDFKEIMKMINESKLSPGAVDVFNEYVKKEKK